ncbi:hypothetical protein COX97_02365 [Candidatus Pacearchaeota archaeon CG_4_10_14_0_2_um_filter_05_32_18]|nr:MAG: hypothetical protein COX97_02365 [Candidatus Pacearchaeota archaeon CG_4_10_14_0_2_um_filter_05_32_18]
MYVYMTKVISISDEAYGRLKRLKNEKSFSEIIVELSNKKNEIDLMSFAGSLSEKEADKIKKEIYSERKMPSRRFN